MSNNSYFSLIKYKSITTLLQPLRKTATVISEMYGFFWDHSMIKGYKHI